jgi:hypothetical protein
MCTIYNNNSGHLSICEQQIWGETLLPNQDGLQGGAIPSQDSPHALLILSKTSFSDESSLP